MAEAATARTSTVRMARKCPDLLVLLILLFSALPRAVAVAVAVTTGQPSWRLASLQAVLSSASTTSSSTVVAPHTSWSLQLLHTTARGRGGRRCQGRPPLRGHTMSYQQYLFTYIVTKTSIC